MKKIIIFYVSILFIFSSCSNPFAPGSDGKSQFEDDYQPGLPPEPSIKAVSEGVKASSGSVLSRGFTKAMKATVSTTNRQISGNHFAGRVSMNKLKMRPN
jgi:hypothetical protein